MKKNNTRRMILIAIFVALIAVGAFIKIPVPVVPFTLQFLFTMLAGLLLGGRNGFIAVIIYIFLGLIGIPIFAEGGGLTYIFKPSFGYIIGFAIASFITGNIANREASPGLKRLLSANFLGLLIVYYYLISNLYLNSPIGLWPLFLYCFILAVPGDILLCILGAVLGKRLIPIIRKDI